MLTAFPVVRHWWPQLSCFVMACKRCKQLSVHGSRLHTSSQTSSGMPSADQLRLQPDNFFDMRQVKRSERSPDFKHKFIKQAIWLESAPKDLVQLVEQWDDGTTDAQSKPSVMLSGEELWKSLFHEPDMWHDKRPTRNNRPDFVHRKHHFPLWLNDWTPDWVTEGVKIADGKYASFWAKADLNIGGSNKDSKEDSVDSDSETEDIISASQEEDVSERWDAQKRQQAVETLLGSCAGSEFMDIAEPPQGSMTVGLLPHQQRALAWMLHREREAAKPAVAGGILGDDQGLGKTITAIALLLTNAPGQEWLSGSALSSSSSEQIMTASQAQLSDGSTDEHVNSNVTLAASPTQSDRHVASDRSPGDLQHGNAAHVEPKASEGNTGSPGYATESPPHMQPRGGTLIIAPLTVVQAVWARELAHKVAQHAQLKVAVHHGLNRTAEPEVLADFDVVITSYETLRSDHRPSEADGLFGVIWWRVLLDEAQKIKRHDAQRSLAVFDLKAKHKWALSGTPIQNRVQELFSYFHFLQYQPFNTQAAFKQYMRNVEDLPNPAHALERLREVMQPVMLRRTKGSTVDDKPILYLPEKKVVVKRLKMSKKEMQQYNHVKDAIVQQLQEKADQRADAATFCAQNGLAHSPQAFHSTLPVFTMLLRLRQACIHSSLLPPELQLGLPTSSSGSSSTSEDEDEETAEGGPAELKTTASLTEALSRMQGKHVQSTKLKRVLRIIKEAQKRPEGPQKVLVFSTFVQALHVMADTLAHAKLGFVMLHGAMDLDERSEALDKFKQDAGTVVMLASLTASSTGITVTCASEVVLMEPSYNPFEENQGIDRVHRIGQEHDVTVHKLLMADTVEERIMELQERKLKMLGAIIEQPDSELKAQGRSLTEADWRALLS